ncbi:MAG: hypothetical protein HZA53_13865 [Planctomycetes bacterium]|nr:hypothetical protein [Planctomycetota bacterium]
MLVLGGALVLFATEHLNADAPHMGTVFFGALAAVPLALAAFVVELFQAARRTPPLQKRRRAWLWAFAALVVLAALPTAGIALLAATFPRC